MWIASLLSFSPDLWTVDVLVTRAQGCHMHTLAAGHFTEHFHEYIFVFDLFALFIISGGSPAISVAA